VFTVNEGESALVDIALFDRMDPFDAAELIRGHCASHRWISEVIMGRPYGSMRRLLAASDDVVADLRWTDLAEALAAHPRPGAGPAVADEFYRGNADYEARFGHPFLICASGRTAAQLLAELKRRLDNPTEIEREIVRAELGATVRLGLIKTFR
jgi:2-oxo-4-hydroxy-4-carboxy-5-ureidoimidazoline decarboxylase